MLKTGAMISLDTGQSSQNKCDHEPVLVIVLLSISAASPIPASYLADRIGTKKTLLLASVPYIIGWILVMFAGNVPTIYASRLISGLGYGIAYTTAPMYLGEIASDDVRGAMATLITVMSKVSPPESRHDYNKVNMLKQVIRSYTYII